MIKSILAIFISGILSFSAAAFEGRVVGVADGDTITVLDASKTQHRIRIAFLDAPEQAQDFGNRSKENLSNMVYGKQVSVPDSKIDKYGRTVSRVFVNGIDVGLEQVKAGMAWHYKQYQNEQALVDRLSYGAAEQNARTQKLGLWQQSNAQRPDEFRHGTPPTIAPQGFTMAAANVSTECACGSSNICTGSKGGRFCTKDDGSKQYQKR